jgi:hypothetical protein
MSGLRLLGLLLSLLGLLLGLLDLGLLNLQSSDLVCLKVERLLGVHRMLVEVSWLSTHSLLDGEMVEHAGLTWRRWLAQAVYEKEHLHGLPWADGKLTERRRWLGFVLRSRAGPAVVERIAAVENERGQLPEFSSRRPSGQESSGPWALLPSATGSCFGRRRHVGPGRPGPGQ